MKTKSERATMKKTIAVSRNINGSSKTIFSLTLIIGFFMFVLNRMTLMMVDDYSYSFSFAKGGERITSLTQIIPSMAAHYYTENGRVIIHGIVQILLMLPSWVFDIMNAVMFCMLCHVIYGYAWRTHHKKHNASFFLMVFAMLWIFTPSFGEVFLWLDGSCNYLWSTTFLLLYLQPVYTDFSREHTKAFWFFYIITGFCMGALIESTSFAAIGLYFLSVIYRRVIQKEKTEFWKLLPMLTMICGYLFLLLSPATQENKIEIKKSIVEQFGEVFRDYFSTFNFLILFGIFVITILLLFELEKKRLVEALVWMFLSVGMNSMFIIASYRPGRSLIGVAVFLIIADAMLVSMLSDHAVLSVSDLWKERTAWFCRILTGYFGLFLLFQLLITFPSGVRDIHKSWIQMQKNENHIKEDVARGIEEIVIPNIESSTDYSAVHKLKYIDLETYNSWPNKKMAKYYGAKRLYGSR